MEYASFSVFTELSRVSQAVQALANFFADVTIRAVVKASPWRSGGFYPLVPSYALMEPEYEQELFLSNNGNRPRTGGRCPIFHDGCPSAHIQ